MEIDFANWLREKLHEANISQAELARRSGISPTHITKVLNGERGLGEQALKAIARALHLPAEAVFREAGLLPPATDKDDPLLRELEYLVGQLSEDKKLIVVDYVRFLVEMEEKRGRGRK